MRCSFQWLYAEHIKRMADVLVSGIALILLFPVMVIVAATVRVRLGQPVLFHQRRPGMNAEMFTLHKFRTMTDSRDSDGRLLPDVQRMTKFGKFLRKTSLDELPELWNIFLGDMSIVGPRPLLEEYLPVYTEREKLRHTVRPGLTGLAQIQGRNQLAWDERLEADVYYVEHMSLKMDFYILMKTVKIVLTRTGIADEDHIESNLAEERMDGNRNDMDKRQDAYEEV